MNKQTLAEGLNAADKQLRLEALRGLRAMLDAGEIAEPEHTADTNNHVHTTYSFSPYSPTAAVYYAYMSGLCTVGIIDHDSISGAREFIEAGKIMRITTTIGCEVRVSFADTPMNGRTLNNPDEPTVAYIALHGLPHNKIDEMDALLSQIREKRNERNIKQVERLNAIIAPHGLKLDFDKDVRPTSMAYDGGSITERHILFALTKKLIEKYGKGAKLIDFIENGMGIAVSGSIGKMLGDTEFFAYDYDVLNVLKSNLVPKFFIEGGEDCFPVKKVVDYARTLGVIPTYCYLGDVAESPTGDKKAQKFEDECIDELFPLVKELGFEAIAYMPSRNTMEQLTRVMDKCKNYEFFEISGEDINQPRQSFICMKQRDNAFTHLADNTWALVGHENAATHDAEECIYSAKMKAEYPVLKDRVAHFKKIGLECKNCK
ncbi:MAG: PHP domain-containing protein [Christensenella sp.]